jgi:hypothetical protein
MKSGSRKSRLRIVPRPMAMAASVAIDLFFYWRNITFGGPIAFGRSQRSPSVYHFRGTVNDSEPSG